MNMKDNENNLSKNTRSPFFHLESIGGKILYFSIEVYFVPQIKFCYMYCSYLTQYDRLKGQSILRVELFIAVIQKQNKMSAIYNKISLRSRSGIS